VHSAQDSKFATLVVGPDKAKFRIHQELLISQSPYFRAALTSGFKEAKTRTIVLKTENPETVEFFVHWLYHQRFPGKSDAPELYALWTDGEGDGDLLTDNLIELHVFGDKYNVPELRTHTITELFYHIEYERGIPLPGADMVRYAFDNLPEGAPMCMYLADTYCCFARDQDWAAFEPSDWPPQFLSHVLSRYTEFAFGDMTRDDFARPCDYHEHSTSEEEQACEKAQDEEAARELQLLRQV
jgi:hypothetical protein